MAATIEAEVKKSRLSPMAANFSNLDIQMMVRRRWRMMLIAVAVGMASSMVYWYVAQRKYESTAQILIMKKDAKLPTRGAEGTGQEDSHVGEDLLATHMQILQSRQIVREALRSHGLEKLPSILSELSSDEEPDDYVIDHMYVTRGGGGQARAAHVLNVSFRHTNDADCEAILQAVVESYRKFLGDTFNDVSTEAARLISDAKIDIAKDLKEAEESYQTFRQEAPLLWKGDESANVHRVNYEQLQATISDVKREYADAKVRLDVVNSGLEDLHRNGASDVEQLALLDEKHIDRLTLLVQVERGEANTEEFQSRQPARLEGARAEYDGLLRLLLKEKSLLMDMGPEHPLVREVREQIGVSQQFLDKKTSRLRLEVDDKRLTPEILVQAYLKLLNFDLLTMAKRQEKLEDLAAQEPDAAKQLISYEIRAENLRKDVVRKQDLYDAVLDRLREINLVKEYGGFITEVIEPVELGEKVWPKASLSLLLGAVLGLVVGTGMAVGAEVRDARFHTPEEVRQSLGLPILTHIPRLKDLAADEPLPEGPATLSPVLIAHHKPRSREAECFRSLRTSIFFASRGLLRQSIACTSPNPGDGKTTMAANLAVSIAQSGRSVLIVDCDLRRPRIHQIFGIQPDIGLSSVITGQAEPTDAIQGTTINNLSAICCGPIPENPAELLTSASFEHLLGYVRDRFDFVILDTPPLLAVADPCIIAQQVDSVLLTVRTSYDSRPQAIEARDLLMRVDAKLIGVVVNVADEERGGLYGYASVAYGGYGYGYTTRYAFDRSAAYFERDQKKSPAEPPSSTEQSDNAVEDKTK